MKRSLYTALSLTVFALSANNAHALALPADDPFAPVCTQDDMVLYGAVAAGIASVVIAYSCS